jgi:hypothetical protein
MAVRGSIFGMFGELTQIRLPGGGGLAQFMLGPLRVMVHLSNGQLGTLSRMRYWGFYLQDDYRIPNLTLNLESGTT